jgi:hypothetical protein
VLTDWVEWKVDRKAGTETSVNRRELIDKECIFGNDMVWKMRNSAVNHESVGRGEAMVVEVLIRHQSVCFVWIDATDPPLF